MFKVLEKYYLSPDKNDIENLEGFAFIMRLKSIIKILTKRTPSPDDFHS